MRDSSPCVAGKTFFGIQSSVPAGLSGVIAIAAGYQHSLALKSDGTVVAWGSNSSGQATVPAGLTGVTSIVAGDWNNIAITSDGSVVVWGDNAHSELTVPFAATKHASGIGCACNTGSNIRSYYHL